MDQSNPETPSAGSQEPAAASTRQAPSTSPRLPRLTVGELISDSLKVTKANFIPFFLVILVCSLPAIIWEYHTTYSAGAPARGSADFAISSFLRFLLGYFLSAIAQAAMVYGTVQLLMGNRVPMGECISKGISRMLPAVGVAFVTSICVGLGLLALLIPGVMIACAYWVAIPVTVVESTGVTASMSRSARLTKGNRLSLFFTLLCIWIVYCLVLYLFSFFTGDADSLPSWLVLQATALCMGVVSAVLSAVAYMRLRERREGVDLRELVKVFE